MHLVRLELRFYKHDDDIKELGQWDTVGHSWTVGHSGTMGHSGTPWDILGHCGTLWDTVGLWDTKIPVDKILWMPFV